MAYQIPEYTAYSSMLSCFRRMVPVPMSLAAGDRYKLHVEELRKNVKWVLIITPECFPPSRLIYCVGWHLQVHGDQRHRRI